MSAPLMALLLVAQVAVPPPAKPAAQGLPQGSLADPYKVILPRFGLDSQSEYKARVEMTKRAFLYREAFLTSDQAKSDPDTLGLFFGRGEYSRMRGNAIIGYYWVSPNFVWKPEWNTVAFTAPLGVHRTSRLLQPKAWDKAMEIHGFKNGLTVSPASPIRVSGAVVWAATDPAASKTRGYATVCEWRIDSPGGGRLYYRCGMMKPSLGAAIGGNLSWVLSFARGIDGKPKQVGRFQVSGTAKGVNSGS